MSLLTSVFTLRFMSKLLLWKGLATDHWMLGNMYKTNFQSHQNPYFASARQLSRCHIQAVIKKLGEAEDIKGLKSQESFRMSKFLRVCFIKDLAQYLSRVHVWKFWIQSLIICKKKIYREMEERVLVAFSEVWWWICPV